jgi:SMC interacting uncharacterized protein involved in chromosome segregation
MFVGFHNPKVRRPALPRDTWRVSDYTVDELLEAQQAIASTVAKIEKALAELKLEAKPQRTLAERRLKALQISSDLIARELERKPDDLV